MLQPGNADTIDAVSAQKVQMSPDLPVDAPGPLLLHSVKVIGAGQETDVIDLHGDAALPSACAAHRSA